MIRKRGSMWYVLDSTGKKVLGKHKTKKEALAQLRAVEASKHSKYGEPSVVNVIEFAEGTTVAKKIDETSDEFRYRVRPPGHFREDTYRRKVIDEGVSIVIANLKLDKAKKDEKTTSMKTQAYSFDKSKFPKKSDVRKWLKNTGIAKFEEMSEAEAEYIEDNDVSLFFEGYSVIPEVELFHTGKFAIRNKVGEIVGHQEFDENDLDDVERNYNELSDIIHPPMKTSHAEDNNGMPVAGWVENVKRVGKKLFGDIRTSAKWFHDQITSGGYRKRSAEFYNNFTDDDGEEHGLTLRAAAFVPIERCKGMPDIAFAEQMPDGEAYVFEEEVEMPDDKKKKGTDSEETKDEEEKKSEGTKEEEKSEDDKSEDKADEKSEGDGDSKEDKKSDDDEKSEDDKSEDADEEDTSDFMEFPEAKKSDKKSPTVLGSSPTVPNVTIPMVNFNDNREKKFLVTKFAEADDNLIGELVTTRRDRFNLQQKEAKNFIAEMKKSGKMTPAQENYAMTMFSPQMQGVVLAFGEGKQMSIADVFKGYVEAGKQVVNFEETAEQKSPDGGQDSDKKDDDVKNSFQAGAKVADEIMAPETEEK